MNLRKIIQRQIRHDRDGVQVAGDVNAAISANVNEPGHSHTHVSSRQRIVQRDRRSAPPERGGATGAPDEPGTD